MYNEDGERRNLWKLEGVFFLPKLTFTKMTADCVAPWEAPLLSNVANLALWKSNCLYLTRMSRMGEGRGRKDSS